MTREHRSVTSTASDIECVAAIDIGTNSTNLLISAGIGHDIARLSTPTRLGAGIGASSYFDPSALERTLGCLAAYREQLDAHRVGRSRVIATSACRRAIDFPEFSAAARSILGYEVELIDGSEEGRLGYLGALSRIDGLFDRNLVIDIGGGSTEISMGDRVAREVRSLEVGAVRLTEKHLLSDPPQPEELVNAIGDVQDLVADACRDVPGLTQVSRVIGCSGTILTIAAVEIGSVDIPRGFRLTRAAAEDVFRTLATEPLADRIHNPGLSAARADIIVAGCCILVGLLRSLDVDSVTVSQGNILDGICVELREGPIER